MSDAYKTLYRGQLPNAAAALYTAPSAVIIRHITVVNTDTVSRTWGLYRNGATDPFLMTPPAQTLGADEMAEWDGVMSLESGGTIQGVASAASVVTVIIDGDEVT